MNSDSFFRIIIDDLDLPSGKFKIYYGKKEIIIKRFIFYNLTLKFENEKNIILVENDYFGALGKFLFKKKATEKKALN